jgi:NAD(P)-dependent dehydrogenase (short-subunit alcohol dehydrogenase family)
VARLARRESSVLADLTGRTALVTGAGCGIGRGIALTLAVQRARVAVTDLDEASAGAVAAAVAGERGDHALALPLDVTDAASVTAAVDEVTRAWGRLDILVSNAGVPADPNRGTDEDCELDWDRTFAVNVKGAVRCCRAVLPSMIERQYGKIVTIASMAGHAQRRTTGAYAASKAALLRYTKGLAATVAAHNINVNAICPGAVWTPFQERDMAAVRTRDPALSGVELSELFRRRYAGVVPLGRPQTPEDVGRLAAFLVSDDAWNITGQCVHVDGGAVLRD